MLRPGRIDIHAYRQRLDLLHRSISEPRSLANTITHAVALSQSYTCTDSQSHTLANAQSNTSDAVTYSLAHTKPHAIADAIADTDADADADANADAVSLADANTGNTATCP